MDNELLEKLSELEHIQWEKWSKTTYKNMCTWFDENKFELDLGDAVGLLDMFYEKWVVNWIPYSKLNEDVKEFDREWAKKVLELVEIYHGGFSATRE